MASSRLDQIAQRTEQRLSLGRQQPRSGGERCIDKALALGSLRLCASDRLRALGQMLPDGRKRCVLGCLTLDQRAGGIKRRRGLIGQELLGGHTIALGQAPHGVGGRADTLGQQLT